MPLQGGITHRRYGCGVPPPREWVQGWLNRWWSGRTVAVRRDGFGRLGDAGGLSRPPCPARTGYRGQGSLGGRGRRPAEPGHCCHRSTTSSRSSGARARAGALSRLRRRLTHPAPPRQVVSIVAGSRRRGDGTAAAAWHKRYGAGLRLQPTLNRPARRGLGEIAAVAGSALSGSLPSGRSGEDRPGRPDR